MWSHVVKFIGAMMAKKKKNTAANIIKRRRNILKKASFELVNKIDWVIDWCKDTQQSMIMKYWELGDMLLDIEDDHGDDALDSLKHFIPEDSSLIQKTKRFAELYTREEAKALTELIMADQMTHLSFGHVRLLVALDSPTLREEALQLTIDNCWSSAQLASHVKELVGKQKRGPRKQAVPKNVKALVEQQLSFVEAWEGRNVNVWSNPTHSLTTQLDRVDPEQYTEELEQQLGRLAHRQRQLADSALLRAEEAEREFHKIKDKLNKGNYLDDPVDKDKIPVVHNED